MTREDSTTVNAVNCVAIARKFLEDHIRWRPRTTETEINSIYDTILTQADLIKKRFEEITPEDILAQIGEKILMAASKFPSPKSKEQESDSNSNNLKNLKTEDTDCSSPTRQGQRDCQAAPISPNSTREEWFLHPLVEEILSHTFTYNHAEDGYNPSHRSNAYIRPGENSAQSVSNDKFGSRVKAGDQSTTEESEDSPTDQGVVRYSNPFDTSLSFDGILPVAKRLSEDETSKQVPVNLFLGLPDVSRMVEDHTHRYRVYLSALTSQYKQHNQHGPSTADKSTRKVPDNWNEGTSEKLTIELGNVKDNEDDTKDKTTYDQKTAEFTDKNIDTYSHKVLNDNIKRIWESNIMEFVRPQSTVGENSDKNPAGVIGSSLKFGTIRSNLSDSDTEDILFFNFGGDSTDRTSEQDLLEQCSVVRAASRAESTDSDDMISDISTGSPPQGQKLHHGREVTSPLSDDFPLLTPGEETHTLSSVRHMEQATLQNKCQTVKCVWGPIPATSTQNLPVRRRLWDDNGTKRKGTQNTELILEDGIIPGSSPRTRRVNSDSNIHKSSESWQQRIYHDNPDVGVDKKIKVETMHPGASINRSVVADNETNTHTVHQAWPHFTPNLQLGQPLAISKPQMTRPPLPPPGIQHNIHGSGYGGRGQNNFLLPAPPQTSRQPMTDNRQPTVTNPFFMQYPYQVTRARVQLPLHQPYPNGHPLGFANNRGDVLTANPNLINPQQQNQTQFHVHRAEPPNPLPYFPSAHLQPPPIYQPRNHQANSRPGFHHTMQHQQQCTQQNVWATSQVDPLGGSAYRQHPTIPVHNNQPINFVQQASNRHRQPFLQQPPYDLCPQQRPFLAQAAFEGPPTLQRPPVLTQQMSLTSTRQVNSRLVPAAASQPGPTLLEQSVLGRPSLQRPPIITQQSNDKSFLQRGQPLAQSSLVRTSIQGATHSTHTYVCTLSQQQQQQQSRPHSGLDRLNQHNQPMSNLLVDLLRKQQQQQQQHQQFQHLLQQQAHYPPPQEQQRLLDTALHQQLSTKVNFTSGVANTAQYGAPHTCAPETNQHLQGGPTWSVRTTQLPVTFSSQLNPTAKPFSAFVSAFNSHTSSASQNQHQFNHNLIQVPINDQQMEQNLSDQLPPWRRPKPSGKKSIATSNAAFGLQASPCNFDPELSETHADNPSTSEAELKSFNTFLKEVCASRNQGGSIKDQSNLGNIQYDQLGNHKLLKSYNQSNKNNNACKIVAHNVKEPSRAVELGEEECPNSLQESNLFETPTHKKATVSVRKYFPNKTGAQPQQYGEFATEPDMGCPIHLPPEENKHDENKNSTIDIRKRQQVVEQNRRDPNISSHTRYSKLKVNRVTRIPDKNLA